MQIFSFILNATVIYFSDNVFFKYLLASICMNKVRMLMGLVQEKYVKSRVFMRQFAF